MALCCIDLLALTGKEPDGEIIREIAASWLVKSGGATRLDRITSFKWARALIQEAKK